MPNLAKAFIEIVLRDEKYKKRLAQNRRGLQRWASSSQRALGTIMGAAGFAGVSAAAISSIRSIAAFQKQVALVNTMLTSRTAPLLGEFRQGLLDVSAEFGESTETLSKGLFDILSASIDATKAMKFLRVSVKAAKGGFTTTAVSADILTTVINAYQLQAEDATLVSDKLFTTVARGKLTFDQLAAGFGIVASTAKSAGLSLNEALAAIATMTRSGLSAKLAITSLSAAMNSFLKPTDQAVTAAAEFGIELSKATLQAEGLLGILSRIPEGALANVFPEREALRGLITLRSNLPSFRSDVEELKNAMGKSSEAFKKATDTLAHRWEQFTNRITAAIKGKGGTVDVFGNALFDRAEQIGKGDRNATLTALGGGTALGAALGFKLGGPIGAAAGAAFGFGTTLDALVTAGIARRAANAERLMDARDLDDSELARALDRSRNRNAPPATVSPPGTAAATQRLLVGPDALAASAIAQARMRLSGNEQGARVAGVRAELQETLRLFRVREEEENKDFARQKFQARVLPDLAIVRIQQDFANREEGERKFEANRAAAERDRAIENRRRNLSSLISRAVSDRERDQDFLNRSLLQAQVFRGAASGAFAKFQVPAAQSIGGGVKNRVEKLLQEQRDEQKKTNRLLAEISIVGP